MASVSAPPRTYRMVRASDLMCGSPEFSHTPTAFPQKITHIDDHVPNDFVVGDKLRMLLLCLEKTVEKIFLAIAKFRILHALHKALHREARSDRKIIELVERARPLWIFPEPFVKSRDLTNLDEISSYSNPLCRHDPVTCVPQLRTTEK